MKMRKSKCVFCIKGIVLNEDCTKQIGNCYCDIDEWDESVSCQEGYCPYYRREKKSEKN